ncbi:MAG: hypothetical protein AB1815_05955 [Bacillota bacterium]
MKNHRITVGASIWVRHKTKGLYPTQYRGVVVAARPRWLEIRVEPGGYSTTLNHHDLASGLATVSRIEGPGVKTRGSRATEKTADN